MLVVHLECITIIIDIVRSKEGSVFAIYTHVLINVALVILLLFVKYSSMTYDTLH